MIDKDKIILAAANLVGFKDVNGIELDDSLKTSTSGIIVNSMPGVDLLLAEEAFKLNAELLPYQSISEYLTALYNEEVINVVNQFLLMEKNKLNSKELVADVDITLNSAKEKRIQNQSFVGYHIKPRSFKSLQIQITSIALQLDTPQELRLFVYDLNQKEPVKTFDIDFDKSFNKVFKAVSELFVNCQVETKGSHLEYLVGYYEYNLDNPQSWQLAQLTQVYAQNFLGCCGKSPFIKLLPYTWISPVSIPKQQFDADFNLPNVDCFTIRNYYADSTFGLSLMVAIRCNTTEIICKNIFLFAQALANKIAIRILLDIFSTTEISGNLEVKRNQCKSWAGKYEFELTGYTDEKGTYHFGILDTIIMQEFSGVDDICLPCNSNNNISIIR